MSTRRYELSDFEWSIIEPQLPNKPRGVPRVDDLARISHRGVDFRSPVARHWQGEDRKA